MKARNIILLVVVAVFTALLMSNIFTGTSQYTDFATAKRNGEEAHIVAQWVKKEQANYDPQKDVFSFYLKDTLNNEALVYYYDPRPDNFDQAQKVVVSGKFENDVFVADKILMKCPSKYKEGEEAVVSEK